MKIDEKILCQEPFISFVAVGPTMGHVWFAHTDCMMEETKLRELKLYIQSIQDDITMNTNEVDMGVIELLINPHTANRERTLDTVLSVIQRTLQASCPHSTAYDPDYRVFPTLIPEEATPDVIFD